MRNVWAVATNTFREAVRDRVLYNLVFFALLMMGAAILVGADLDWHRRDRDREPGVEGDLRDRTFDRGVHRRGTCFEGDGQAHAVRVAGQAGGALGISAGKIRRPGDDAGGEHGGDGGGIVRGAVDVKHHLERSDWYVLVAVYLILLKLALVVALAMLFSCFTTPFLAILFTAGIYIAGVFAEDLRTMQAMDITPATMKLLRGISYLLPNFENFNVMGAVAHGRGVPGDSGVAGYGCTRFVYAGIVLASAQRCVFATEPEMKIPRID